MEKRLEFWKQEKQCSLFVECPMIVGTMRNGVLAISTIQVSMTFVRDLETTSLSKEQSFWILFKGVIAEMNIRYQKLCPTRQGGPPAVGSQAINRNTFSLRTKNDGNSSCLTNIEINSFSKRGERRLEREAKEEKRHKSNNCHSQGKERQTTEKTGPVTPGLPLPRTISSRVKALSKFCLSTTLRVFPKDP